MQEIRPTRAGISLVNAYREHDAHVRLERGIEGGPPSILVEVYHHGTGIAEWSATFPDTAGGAHDATTVLRARHFRVRILPVPE